MITFFFFMYTILKFFNKKKLFLHVHLYKISHNLSLLEVIIKTDGRKKRHKNAYNIVKCERIYDLSFYAAYVSFSHLGVQFVITPMGVVPLFVS